MAGPNINVGTATAYLTVNADGVSAGAARAKTSLHGMDDVVQNMWWGLRNIGRAAVVAGGAIGASFVYAAKSAIAWEDAMAGVARTNWDSQKSAEANAASIADLNSQLLNIVNAKPVNPIDVAGIAEAAGSLGVAQADVARFTSVVADLAATTNLTADQAGTDLARIGALTGVSGEGFEHLASAILETGRTTAATETEITGLSTRIAPIAAIFGLSADQVIGFSAAIASAGIKSQEGGTAFQKTFIDMQGAISEGGATLENFAAISGMTSEEFKTQFGQDAAGTMAKFVQGLGEMGNTGQDVTAALAAVGITEARQVKTLLALGVAQGQTVNQSVRLTNILGVSNESFKEGNALQEITARQYATTAAQMKILQNQVFTLAAGFGQTLLGPLQLVNQVMQAFILGLRQMPGPARQVLLVMVVMEGALFAFLAAITLIIPRIVLVNGALDRMRNSATGAASANMELAGSELAAAGGAAAQGAATAGATGSSAKFANTISKTGKAAGILAAVLAVAGIATTIYGFTQKDAAEQASKMTESNQDLVNAIRQQAAGTSTAADEWIAYALNAKGAITVLENMGLTLRETIDLINGTAEAAAVAKFNDIKGNPNATPEQKKAAQDVLDLAVQYRDASKLAVSFGQAIDDTSVAEDKAALSTKELKKANTAAYDAARKRYEQLESIAQATLDYVDATASAERATLSVADAQDKYRRALAELADQGTKVTIAELKIASARSVAAISALKVQDAEVALNRARQKGQIGLRESELAYADAQDGVVDAQARLLESEEALAKLRRGSSIEEITKATNDLANAQLSLKKAELGVRDAEWLIQHLREEGAGNRDLEQAQLTLDSANQDVANSTQDIADAQKELNDLRNKDPKKIAEAERDVAKAQREVERAILATTEAGWNLDDQRRQFANDTEYWNALKDLQDAQIDQLSATLDIHSAQQDLLDLLNGGLQRAATSAALDYRDALYAVAKANADVIKAQLEMQGQFVSTGRYAQILGGELGKVMNQVPDEGTFHKLREWRTLLSNVPDPGAPPEQPGDPSGSDGTGTVKKQTPKDTGTTKGILDGLNPPAANGPEKDQFSNNWINWITAGIVGIAAGLVLGPSGGIIAGAATKELLDATEWDKAFDRGWETIKATLSGKISPGDALGLIKDAGLGELFGNMPLAIWHQLTAEESPFKSLGEAVGGWLEGFWKAVTDTFSNFFGTNGTGAGGGGTPGMPTGSPNGGSIPSVVPHIISQLFSGEIDLSVVKQPFTVLPGIIISTLTEHLTGVPQVFSNIIGQIPGVITGFLPNIINILPGGVGQMLQSIIGYGPGIIGFFSGLPGQITGALGNVGFLASFGINSITGLFTGITTTFTTTVLPWFSGLPGQITQAAMGLITNNPLYTIGKQIIEGFLLGLQAAGAALPNVMNGIMSVIPQGIKDFFHLGSPSKLTKELGGFVTQGFALGLTDQVQMVKDASISVAQAALGPLQDGLEANSMIGLGAMSANRALVGAGAPVNNTTTNGGDQWVFNMIDQPTATELMNKAMWEKRVRNRGAN